MRNETYDRILQEARKRTLRERTNDLADQMLNLMGWTHEELSDYLQLKIEQWVEDGMPR